MSDPLELVRRLEARLIEQVEPLGLRVIGFAVLPGKDGSPDHVQALFEIDADEIGKEQAEKDIDAEVNQFRAEMAEAERERKAAESREKLRKLMERGNGFLQSPGEA